MLAATSKKPPATSTLDEKLREFQAARPAATPAKEAAPTSSGPLDKSDIMRVMRGVETGARSCVSTYGVTGIVNLKISVVKSGAVDDVTLSGPLARTPSGACVRDLVKAATFPASDGLRFDYLVKLRQS